MGIWQGLDPEGLATVGVWLAQGRAGEAPRTQHPVDEIIAEHRLTFPVLLAIEHELQGLMTGKALRYEAWELIVEFIGNFLHLVHRKKEDEGLFLPLVAQGWREHPDLAIEHGRAERATHGLCEAISDGDWEMTLRLGSAYAFGMRRHMEREEQGALRLARRDLTPEQLRTTRALFDRVEAEAMPAGRSRLVEIMRALCALTGVDLRPYGLR